MRWLAPFARLFTELRRPPMVDYSRAFGDVPSIPKDMKQGD